MPLTSQGLPARIPGETDEQYRMRLRLAGRPQGMLGASPFPVAPSPYTLGAGPQFPLPIAPPQMPPAAPPQSMQDFLAEAQRLGTGMVPAPRRMNPFLASFAGGPIDLTGTSGTGSLARGLSQGFGRAMGAREQYAEAQRQLSLQQTTMGLKLLEALEARRKAAAPEEYTLGPGQTRFRGTEQIAAGPPVSPPSEPLVPVSGPGGTTIYVPRGQAAGMPAPQTERQPSRVSLMMEATELENIPEHQRTEQQLNRYQQITEVLEQLAPSQMEFSPEAATALGNYAYQTGTLPVPLGLGSGPARAAVVEAFTERAQQAAKSGEPSPVEAQAQFRADRASLQTLQGMADRLEAFEGTATRNLEIARNIAQQLVDAGSPLLNRPIRLSQLAATGDPNIAAFNAALHVSLMEIARIITNPNLTGQLPVTFQQEIADLVSGGTTIPQLLSVMNVLVQDMNNRLTETKQQIGIIRNRLSGTTAPAAGGASAEDIIKAIVGGQ